MDYGLNSMECAKEVTPRPLEPATVTEELKIKKAMLEKKLADVNAAIEALEANPGVEKVLNLISKTGRY